MNDTMFLTYAGVFLCMRARSAYLRFPSFTESENIGLGISSLCLMENNYAAELLLHHLLHPHMRIRSRSTSTIQVPTAVFG